LIEGEPGIGKSALVRAALAEAAGAGGHVFWGAGDELGQALPLLPFLDALRVREPFASPRRNTILRLLRGELAADRGTDVSAALAEQLLALVSEQCAAAFRSACRSHSRTAVSIRSKSFETWPIDRSPRWHSSTISALNSGVNERRRRGFSPCSLCRSSFRGRIPDDGCPPNRVRPTVTGLFKSRPPSELLAVAYEHI
jgi:AAA ATPase domain